MLNEQLPLLKRRRRSQPKNAEGVRNRETPKVFATEKRRRRSQPRNAEGVRNRETPKAFATEKRRRRSQPRNAEGVRKFQPRVGACDNPGVKKRFCNQRWQAFARSRHRFANACSVDFLSFLWTQGCFNPGLEFANAFGVSNPSCADVDLRAKAASSVHLVQALFTPWPRSPRGGARRATSFARRAARVRSI